MTDKDLNKLGTLMDSKLNKFRNEVGEEIVATRDGLREEIVATRDGLREEIVATRDGLREEIVATRDGLREEIVASENRVIKAILEFISEHFLPMIEEKADKTDIDRVERKLDFYIDQSIDLKSRVGEIESLPTVAHELKLRRKKH